MGLALGIWGDAGIGKTHQTQELLRNLPCQNLSLHATTALSSLVQEVPKAKKLALWAEHNLKRLVNGETLEKETLLAALSALFAALAPFVLHLEDIHELDDERLEFICNLAKRVQKVKGAALMVTSRREPPAPFLGLELESLSQAETQVLLETELKSNLPKEALQWIYDKAAGNPLYSLEYLRFLSRQGFLWSNGKTWHWRRPENNLMPVTVEALIEQLLVQARAEPLQRYVLESKAFLPLDSGDELLQKVARVNKDELQLALTGLSQQGIFKDKGFAHPLFTGLTQLRRVPCEEWENEAAV